MKDLFASIRGSLSGKLLPWIIGLALVAAGTFVVISKNRDNKLVETGRQSGASEAITKGHESTLGQLKDANNAEQDIRASGERSDARYLGCLQDSDRPGSCDRYKPL